MEKSNENIIEWLTGENEVEVTVSQRKWVNRIRELTGEYPDEIKVIDNSDGSISARLPLKWIKIRGSRTLTEAERRERAEVLRRNISNADNYR